MKKEAREGDEVVQPRYRPGQPLVVFGQSRRNRDAHAKERSTTHRRGNSTKPFLAPGCLATSSRMPPWACASTEASSPCSPGPHTPKFHALAHVLLLHRPCQLLHLRPVLLGGRRDAPGEQVSQSVDTAACTFEPFLGLAPS